jgi:hypothetical protein
MKLKKGVFDIEQTQLISILEQRVVVTVNGQSKELGRLFSVICRHPERSTQ